MTDELQRPQPAGAEAARGSCSPPPDEAELVCLEVLKVYDFVFQQEDRDDICVPIPAAAGPIPPGATVECEILSVECVEMTPRLFFPPPQEGFANITLLFTVTLQIRLLRADGTEFFVFQRVITFMKTVTMCAPEGTEIQCEIGGQFCGPAAITAAGQVCLEVVLCALIQAKARVKLLIPAFGFCQPRPAMVLPKPVVTCPPEPLFPPQCPLPEELFSHQNARRNR